MARWTGDQIKLVVDAVHVIAAETRGLTAQQLFIAAQELALPEADRKRAHWSVTSNRIKEAVEEMLTAPIAQAVEAASVTPAPEAPQEDPKQALVAEVLRQITPGVSESRVKELIWEMVPGLVDQIVNKKLSDARKESAAVKKRRILIVGACTKSYASIRDAFPEHYVEHVVCNHGAVNKFEAKWDLVVFLIKECSHNRMNEIRNKTRAVYVTGGHVSRAIRTIKEELCSLAA